MLWVFISLFLKALKLSREKQYSVRVIHESDSLNSILAIESDHTVI
jgi:hypothetical protein